MSSRLNETEAVLKLHSCYFPGILFVSNDEMEEYIKKASPEQLSKKGELGEGEESPIRTDSDPRNHMYILKQIVGRNPTTAAFVALRGSDSTKIIAKIVMLNDEKQAAYARSETHCLAVCNHFGIVKHYDDFKVGEKLLLIMEYGSGGDLNKQIKQRYKEKMPYKEHEVGLLFYQIVLALDFIHRHRMIHRDMKSANIFLMPTGIIKLGDFGFSKQFNDSVSHDVGTSFCGTPYYLAPELWERKRYSKKADMWSVGVILYELLTLTRPFKGPSQREIMQQVLYGTYDAIPSDCNISDDMKQMLNSLLSKDPAERPSTNTLLQSKFMKYVGTIFEEIVATSGDIDSEAKKEILEQLSESRSRQDQMNSVRYGGVSTAVHHESYLTKLSTDRRWKKRYFCLKDGSLRISLSENPEKDASTPQSVGLSAIQDVLPVPAAYCRSHPHQLIIWFFNNKNIIARAESQEERDVWIARIHQACGM